MGEILACAIVAALLVSTVEAELGRFRWFDIAATRAMVWITMAVLIALTALAVAAVLHH